MALLRAYYVQAIYLQVIVASYSRSLFLDKTLTTSRFVDLGRQGTLTQVATPKQDQIHSHDREAPVAPSLVLPTDKVTVEFGILVKHFYGIDFAQGTFATDAIIAASWTDMRNVDLIPVGEKNVRLSSETATSNIWTPNIKVTNFAPSGVSPISTSFLIEPSGVTTKVERTLLIARNSFEYEDFPFDKQVLEIRIASSTYMDDQVVLTPISNASYWGADTSLFRPWDLVNTSIFTVVDVNAAGLFSKSRGILQLLVVRPVDQFCANVFGPSILLVAMSWGSLFLPLSAPFAMPRISLNTIALLAEVTLAANAQSLTPQGSITWMDKYLEICFVLQFILLIQNITVLSLKHRDTHSKQLKDLESEFADSMSFHLLWFFPVFWAVNLLVVWFAPDCFKAVIVVSMTLYFVFHIWDYRRKMGEEAHQDEIRSANPQATSSGRCLQGLHGTSPRRAAGNTSTVS